MSLPVNPMSPPVGPANKASRLDRALGALWGGALGDALGMPTQTLSRREIEHAYGSVDGFLGPYTDHPVSHGLSAGSVTDDTEQSLLLAELLIVLNGSFDERRWVDALMAWEKDVAARGLRDLLGPSTKRALESILQGAPAEQAGRYGNTNGAAMRIAPVGIATPAEPLSALIDQVEKTCRVTHNTGLAIGAASAVAATISVGIEGASWREAIGIALSAAREGQYRGHERGTPDIAEQIEWACRLAEEKTMPAAIEALSNEIGTNVSAWQSVPTAFGVLHVAQGDAWSAGLIGARIGGDTDTIAAISAGMAGACSGLASLPVDKINVVATTNKLDMHPIAMGLIGLRDRAPVSLEIAG